ncbi:hypothetical protein BWZ29_14595 [Enterobacter cancerogenus]|uniref:hypothetical protein n=1 Tax=Enterobacter chuandaensis TaxID=2497875 RepID=UPI0009B240D7|nr:hypothetical protein [Enterobacter chuandaensis]MCM7588082.1 hypothetical protein [Enterobacter chuandaensis]OQD48223.1 hypothetical protein BWZ29_14595 [Enterobacter cancerogenus]
MKRTAEPASTRDIKSTSPSNHAAPDAVSTRQPSEADRVFIRSMNEWVEKHGTITDDEFFRVL